MKKWLTLLLCLLPTIAFSATNENRLASDNTATILIVSDPHYGGIGGCVRNANGPASEAYKLLLGWADTLTTISKPTHILMCGDLLDDPPIYNYGITINNFVAWFDSINVGNLTLVPVLGNHDGSGAAGICDKTELNRSGRLWYPDTFFSLKDEYKAFFQGRNYYYIDVGPVRILSINNMADTVNTVHRYTCLDPDSIKNPNSTINKWVVSALKDGKNKGINWNIIATHRAWLAPNVNAIRPTFDVNTRKNIVQDLYITNGANIFAQGDLHIGYLTKKLNGFTADSTAGKVKGDTLGAYFLGTRSHYVIRDTTTTRWEADTISAQSSIPDKTLLQWVMGNTEELGAANYLFAMYLDFDDDFCTLKVIRCGMDYYPAVGDSVLLTAGQKAPTIVKEVVLTK